MLSYRLGTANAFYWGLNVRKYQNTNVAFYLNCSLVHMNVLYFQPFAFIFIFVAFAFHSARHLRIYMKIRSMHEIIIHICLVQSFQKTRQSIHGNTYNYRRTTTHYSMWAKLKIYELLSYIFTLSAVFYLMDKLKTTMQHCNYHTIPFTNGIKSQ